MAPKFFRYFFFLASLLLTVKSYPQNIVVDSLLRVLPETTDTSRFNTLSKLFWNTFNTDPKLAKSYIDEERELAKELDLELFIGRSYNDLGVYYWTQSDLDSSIWSFKTALEIFEKIGNIHRENATLNNLGNLYADKGDFEEALSYHMRSLKIKEELKDEKGMAVSYLNIAQVNIDLNYLDRALEYFHNCLDIVLPLNDSARILDTYSGIATVNFNKENYKASIQYNLKGLEISRKLENKYMEALCLENLGQGYYKIDRYDSALLCTNLAMEINTGLGNRHALAVNNRSMGYSYKGKRMYSRALHYLNRSLVIAAELNAMRDVMYAYEALSSTYETQGDYKQALDYFKKFKTIKDSILSEDTKLKVNELEISYQTEKKEKEIAQQNLEIETLKKAALIQDFRRKWLIAGLITAILLGGFVFYGQKQRMKRQKVESEKRQLEVENELILRKKELTSHTLHLVQKNELLDDINLKLRDLKKSPEAHQKEISRLIQRIKNDKVADKDWENFKMYFDQVHEDFDTKLRENFNDLTGNEIRLAALMKMKLSTKEIASILNISPDSVNKARYRLRKKLNMNSDDRLEDFILAL